MRSLKSRAAKAALTVATVAVAAACVGCAPQAEAPAPSDGLNSNDMVVKGEYTPYDPAAEAEVTAGAAIEGSEEEQLQQERIAGGAAGGVVSQNLEPLVGITDYSEGEYIPAYGIACDIPEVVHGETKGTTCTSCHGEGSSGAGTEVPQSHIGQNLTDEDCLTCHEL